MEDYSYTTSGGVSFCGLLGIVFIVLKLCNILNWSWIWVLSPIWIDALIIIIFILWILIKEGGENNG